MSSDSTLFQRFKRAVADRVLPRFRLTTLGSLERANAALDRTAHQLDEVSALLKTANEDRNRLADLLRERHETQAERAPLPAMFHVPAELPNQAALLEYLAAEKPGTPDAEADALYVALATSFHGPAGQLKARQALYLDHLPFAHADLPVLDAGCGRGEFLELLHERDIRAVGVDTNALNVEHVRANGLDVYHGDAIEYIRSLAPGSLAAVTALEVVEHLPHDSLRDMLRLAFDRIAPGGFILLETINPHCLFTLRTFFMDPTHQHPVPPELLAVLVEFYGFRDLMFFYKDPLPEALDTPAAPARRDRYQTYAVLGVKPAS